MKYLKMIPSGWDEVKVKDYIRLIDSLDDDSTIEEMFENAFYVFTGIEIYNAKMTFEESAAIGHRLQYLHEELTETKHTRKYKRLKDLSYQDYMNVQLLMKPEKLWYNIIPLLKIFSVEPFDEKQITMQEAMNGFFLLSRKVNKRLWYLRISLRFKAMKIIVAICWQKMLHKLKGSSPKNGDGLI